MLSFGITKFSIVITVPSSGMIKLIKGKSFLVLNAAQFWITVMGYQADIIMLEETEVFHVRRALAQELERSDILDLEWASKHPEEWEQIKRDNEGFINGFGKHIHVLRNATVPALLNQIRLFVNAGVRIIVVDPITAKIDGRFPWEDDKNLVDGLKTIIEPSNCSLVLMMHPKKNSLGLTTDDLAGHSSYGKLIQTVLYMKSVDEYTAQVRTNHTIVNAPVNREMMIWKARNGRGSDFLLGFWFDHTKLKFVEQGIIED